MWPWGHLAVGYLLFSIGSRGFRGKPPSARETLVLVVSTQLPDLIDKPLAWTFNLLPNGRSLGHSLLVAVMLLVVATYLLRGRDARQFIPAFGVGYVSHLFGDALYPALAGEYHYTTFLAYPLLPAIEYPNESTSILSHFLNMEFTTLVAVELGFVALVALLWIVDGRPGLRRLRPSNAVR